ncbi:MAG: HIT domain-containing protein [Acidobacteriota bacterium]|nr:HIT domain-containing protein [Acidobacteriota bacterium]MDE3170499.1 HIT domain-containing protein [Acidobacteriota bacterium]
MDYLWTPWRYRYIANASKDDRCIFCDALAANDDARTLVVFRGERNFIILNRYPYTSGHVMVVPYAHVADLLAAEAETLAEMMRLAQRVQGTLARVYRPEGYNLGVNLGRAAGAGITGHLHLHVLPRWAGDANFMTVAGETRVEPEELSTTFEKLHRELNK